MSHALEKKNLNFSFYLYLNYYANEKHHQHKVLPH